MYVFTLSIMLHVCQIAEVTVGFSQPVYQFMGGMGAVELMLVVSGLGAGILECDVDVSIIYTDGPKASMY